MIKTDTGGGHWPSEGSENEKIAIGRAVRGPLVCFRKDTHSWHEDIADPEKKFRETPMSVRTEPYCAAQ